MPPHPPTIKIEAIQSNGISPHDKGHTGQCGVLSVNVCIYIRIYIHIHAYIYIMCELMCVPRVARYHHYHLEFQKYFLVKNLKVLLEKQVPEFPHMRQVCFCVSACFCVPFPISRVCLSVPILRSAHTHTNTHTHTHTHQNSG